MTRGEVWLAEVGRKARPVLVVTRPEVIDVRQLVTVAEITTQTRSLGSEVDFDHKSVGLARPSAVNCDGLHTIAQSTLTKRVGMLDEFDMVRVCQAISYALGCT